MTDGQEELHRAMGRVEGKLDSLDASVRDERTEVRAEHLRIMTRLEVMETQLNEIAETHKSMQVQVYSNKHGIEGINDDLLNVKMLYSRGLGAWAVIIGVGSFVSIVLAWGASHMTEVSAALRALFTGK